MGLITRILRYVARTQTKNHFENNLFAATMFLAVVTKGNISVSDK